MQSSFSTQPYERSKTPKHLPNRRRGSWVKTKLLIKEKVWTFQSHHPKKFLKKLNPEWGGQKNTLNPETLWKFWIFDYRKGGGRTDRLNQCVLLKID